jgi:hypothetical protein
METHTGFLAAECTFSLNMWTLNSPEVRVLFAVPPRQKFASCVNHTWLLQIQFMQQTPVSAADHMQFVQYTHFVNCRTCSVEYVNIANSAVQLLHNQYSIWCSAAE